MELLSLDLIASKWCSDVLSLVSHPHLVKVNGGKIHQGYCLPCENPNQPLFEQGEGDDIAKWGEIMIKQREAARLILTTGYSNRLIGRTVGLAPNTVKRYRRLVMTANTTWSAVTEMNDSEIGGLLQIDWNRTSRKVAPDWPIIYREMQQKHVTLQMLWEDYRMANPGSGIGYSQFTSLYRKYIGTLDRSMRQTHRAGEVVFVDFAGRTLSFTDPETGRECPIQLFVAALGCSNYTFAYGVKSQKLHDWIECHNKMFAFFGGVPQIIVPDNLKSAVIKAGPSPDLNRTYLEMGNHYSVAIVPTRVRKPKDKAKVEGAVLIVERWIIAKLRHRKFFSLEEINEAISELLRELNDRPFKKLPGCRRSRFEELDKPLLSPLPTDPFEFAEWSALLKVGPDYHLYVQDHYYSVPHSLVGVRLEARVASHTVEFFHQGRRVASHMRSDEVGGHSTQPAHQPKSHRSYAEMTPAHILKWANGIGPATTAVVQHQFDSHAHPLLAMRTCSSMQKLSKGYEPEHFEAACRRAQKINSLTLKSVKSILKRRLAEIDVHTPIQVNLPLHDNLRGPDYYITGGE